MEEPTFKKFLWVLALVFGLFVLLIVVLIFKVGLPKGLISSQPEKLNGLIYLTLAPVGSKSLDVYTYDPAQNVTAKLTQGPGWSFTARAGGPQGIKAYFISNTDPTTGKIFVTPQIEGITPTGSLTVFSNTATAIKRNPVYLPSLDSFIYEGKKVSSASTNPDDTNIYVLASKKLGHYLTHGALPALAPNNSIVVLRSDGLYLVPISTTTSEAGTLIWPSKIPAKLQDQFAVSPVGNEIAWSFPGSGKIYLMKVQTWQPFVAEPDQTIDATALWPVFSPDGSHLAAEEVDFAATSTEPTNPRLAVFDLINHTKQIVQNLRQYEQAKIFVSDWR
jgi:hypothetical protein